MVHRLKWASNCPGELVKTQSAGGSTPRVLGCGLVICISDKCLNDADADLMLRTTLWEPLWEMPWHFSLLQIHFLPLESHRLLPTVPKMEWKILFMYVYYFSIFWEMGNKFYSNPNTIWQNKTRLISVASLSTLTHPSLFIQSVPTSTFAQMLRIVCMFLQLQPCLFTCTICVSPSPPLNSKVLECLSL